MKWLTVIVVFALFGCALCWKHFHRGRYHAGNVKPPPFIEGAPKEAQIFKQKLDHFDIQNSDVWDQRYYYNDTFYKYGGPVFLMIGGEGPISSLWAVSGSWVSYAQKYNASFFIVEHRFYGESRPTKDLSIDNLSYLSSDQALADLAYFITFQNEKLGYPYGTNWITFGGFYGGSLAAWMRLKYPHLVQGAVASSAPVLADFDFKDYYKIVRDALYQYNPKCTTAIKKGMNQLLLWMKNYLGRRTVNRIFKLCTSSELNSPEDDGNFIALLADHFAEVVQFNRNNEKNTSQSEHTIDSVCEIMLDPTLILEINKLAMVNFVILSENNEPCLDFNYNMMIDQFRGTNWTSPGARGDRQWLYQSCTEFGFFPTSALKITEKMFGDFFPAEFFIKQCTNVFGPNFNVELVRSGVERTNIMYGGSEAHTSNVAYVHGSLDPWHSLGILKVQHEGATSVYIEGESHCSDMYPPSPVDSSQLTAARKQIEDMIGMWLQN